MRDGETRRENVHMTAFRRAVTVVRALDSNLHELSISFNLTEARSAS